MEKPTISPTFSESINKKDIADERDFENFTKARSFIKSIALTPDKVSVSVGVGSINKFFWSDFVKPTSEDRFSNSAQWERLIFDSGAKLTLFDPHYNDGWLGLKNKLILAGKSDQVVVPIENAAYFENSTLQDHSVDLLIINNFFGQPLFVTNDIYSKQIVKEIRRVIANEAFLVVGDKWADDLIVTQSRLKLLRNQGVNLWEVNRSDKGDTKWIAYQVQF